MAAAAAAGEPACRVAVLVCGPPPMVDAVQDAAAAAGCHFHAEKFIHHVWEKWAEQHGTRARHGMRVGGRGPGT